MLCNGAVGIKPCGKDRYMNKNQKQIRAKLKAHRRKSGGAAFSVVAPRKDYAKVVEKMGSWTCSGDRIRHSYLIIGGVSQEPALRPLHHSPNDGATH